MLVGIALFALAATAVAQPSGVWLESADFEKHLDNDGITHSVNAWFHVLTGRMWYKDSVEKVFIDILAVDENFTNIQSFRVHASKMSIMAVQGNEKLNQWRAEFHHAWTVLPVGIVYSVKAEIAMPQPSNSSKILLDNQSPHYFVLRPSDDSSRNRMELVDYRFQVSFDDNIGAVVDGVVRIFIRDRADLDNATVKVLYTIDGWQTVQSSLAIREDIRYSDFSFRLTNLNQSYNLLDLPDLLEFAIRFADSQGKICWEIYQYRLLAAILAPDYQQYPPEPLSGKFLATFVVNMDDRYWKTTTERIVDGSRTVINSGYVTVDTSLVKNGDSAKYLVTAVAFGKVVVSRMFEFLVWNPVLKERISWKYNFVCRNLFINPLNSSQLILSGSSPYISGLYHEDFALVNRETVKIERLGTYAEPLRGVIFVDPTDSQNVYVLRYNSLSKVSFANMSHICYQIDLEELDPSLSAVEFTKNFVFVFSRSGLMSFFSHPSSLMSFDKQSGILQANRTSVDFEAIVGDPTGESLYLLYTDAVQKLNSTTLEVQKSWKASSPSSFTKARVCKSGLLWILNFDELLAVQLTDELLIKVIGRFRMESLVDDALNMIADPESDSLWMVLNTSRKQLLKFSFAETPVVVLNSGLNATDFK